MENQLDDQDRLIINETDTFRQNFPAKSSLITFILIKLLPFTWLYFSLMFFPSSFCHLVFVFLAIVDLWLCRRRFSYALVGLTWSLKYPESGDKFEDLIVLSFEPDPFVPSPVNSNVFWAILAGTTAVYVVISIFHLVRLEFGLFLLTSPLAAIELLNAALLMRCARKYMRQAEESFRAVMINSVHAEFQDAVPVPEEEPAAAQNDSLSKSENKTNEAQAKENKADNDGKGVNNGDGNSTEAGKEASNDQKLDGESGSGDKETEEGLTDENNENNEYEEI
ncbi:hypothetical protein TRFO_13343 [Tritrichomonas foetus]|uniref:Golgi apparatus membrane protein TVP23 homolog n=1 Tax=Tritrichomonas foetus TaxID=1144522 RepID=A0A1J4L2L8_9EUKA|nr:hypothetical protein TRFO_13343 [Tritrichomonas foetus]|eukprot:OHT16190.1 hypothetical protein TRFO_13343 [Tritrichomonas foetus]